MSMRNNSSLFRNMFEHNPGGENRLISNGNRLCIMLSRSEQTEVQMERRSVETFPSPKKDDLSVDRPDYTKGIDNRLIAYQ